MFPTWHTCMPSQSVFVLKKRLGARELPAPVANSLVDKGRGGGRGFREDDRQPQYQTAIRVKFRPDPNDNGRLQDY